LKNSDDNTDYNIGLGYDLQGWAIAAKYYTVNGTSSTFRSANTLNGQQLYKNAVVVSVTKGF
jgi:hypothetical protein